MLAVRVLRFFVCIHLWAMEVMIYIYASTVNDLPMGSPLAEEL